MKVFPMPIYFRNRKSVNNILFLVMMLLGFLCLTQIYHRNGLLLVFRGSKCSGKNCDYDIRHSRFKMFSAKNYNISLTNFSDERVFVYDAYLTKSSEIRIMTIRKCKNPKQLVIRLDTNISAVSIPLQSYPIQACPWFFAPKCHFVGYFAVANIYDGDVRKQIEANQLPAISVSSSSLFEDEKQLNLVDVRLKSTLGRHNLAVCLQPIFFLADWTLLIQFFETWIVQGATKFFIYVQSMAPEVDELLRVYEADPDIDVQRVHWAPLPNEEELDEPNNFVYRGEVVASVNDCVLRARGQAKLVVSSDLDEIIYSYNNSLISLMEKLILKHPKAAAFLFRTRMAAFQNQWANATNPDDINFDMLANISVESKVWPVGQRSKLIMFPELIRKAHVHNVLAVEKGHVTVNLDPQTGIVLHLRRIRIGDSDKDFESNYLKPFVPLYNRQWRKRLNLIGKLENMNILKKKQWPNRGLKVLEEVDRCRVDINSMKSTTCVSYFKCFENITAVDESEWIWADQKWVTI